jgi:hypothetical protein
MHLTQRAMTHRRRARRRCRRRQRRCRWPRAHRKVACCSCRARSRASTTCSPEGGRAKDDPRRRRTTSVDAGVVELTPVEAAAAPPVRSATGASARICERGGRGAIMLSGAAAGSLAGGAQAARKHRAAAAAAARGELGEGASGTVRQRRGAHMWRNLSSVPELHLDRELRTGRSICISKADHLDDRVGGASAGQKSGRARLERN